MERRRYLSRKILIALLALIFISGVMAIPDANAWWDAKWHQRKKIQFDTTAAGADIKENVTDLPVLVRLHTGNFTFSNANPDGSDLRLVSSDDKSPLKYHIEKFDPKEEIALIWVKVPTITAASNQDYIWLYYGNPSAPDGQDRGGTYDVNQVAVYHLGEQEGQPKDATAYGNNAASFTGKLGLPSIIGSGAQLGGSGELMKIPKSPSMDFSKGFTFSAWVRPNQLSENARLFSWDDGKQSIIVGLDGSRAYCSVSAAKGQVTATPKTAPLTSGKWHYLAVSVDADKQVTLYLDGGEAASSKFKGAVPAPSSEIVIGASDDGKDNFTGDLDEVQLSNTSRPAGWLKAAFQSQNPDGPLLSYMEEESGGGGGESLTIQLGRIIVRTITLDGWLIIGFLFLLGCTAALVFVQKIATLRQAKKANRMFSEPFKRMEDPLALAEKNGDFPGSPLYTVYQAGCTELKIWKEKNSGPSSAEASFLSVGALDAFKAAIEKEAMFESRKLSAGMIIMNICVAGGPFLGLLGTVWGVMNTFAGLAESGEASLAAIAPGVASALACTMAGLLCAIPALFASSYITGQIKDMNADVNVFMGEFVLKVEQHQREAA